MTVVAGTLLLRPESGLMSQKGSGPRRWHLQCLPAGLWQVRNPMRMGVYDHALLCSRVRTNIIHCSDNSQFTGIFPVSFLSSWKQFYIYSWLSKIFKEDLR